MIERGERLTVDQHNARSARETLDWARARKKERDAGRNQHSGLQLDAMIKDLEAEIRTTRDE